MWPNHLSFINTSSFTHTTINHPSIFQSSIYFSTHIYANHTTTINPYSFQSSIRHTSLIHAYTFPLKNTSFLHEHICICFPLSTSSPIHTCFLHKHMFPSWIHLSFMNTSFLLKHIFPSWTHPSFINTTFLHEHIFPTLSHLFSIRPYLIQPCIYHWFIWPSMYASLIRDL